MTAAGYLKAVSVGFIPVRTVTPSSNPKDWDAAVAALGLEDVQTSVSCIYLEQQQLELSACVIGANANAVAKAQRAGLLTDSDVTAFIRLRPSLEIELDIARRSVGEISTRTLFSFFSQPLQSFSPKNP